MVWAVGFLLLVVDGWLALRVFDFFHTQLTIFFDGHATVVCTELSSAVVLSASIGRLSLEVIARGFARSACLGLCAKYSWAIACTYYLGNEQS